MDYEESMPDQEGLDKAYVSTAMVYVDKSIMKRATPDKTAGARLAADSHDGA